MTRDFIVISVVSAVFTAFLLFMNVVYSMPNVEKSINAICGDKRVYVNETKKCFTVNLQGFCAPLMVVKPIEQDLLLGECRCKIFRKPGCDTRPTVYWEKTKRCYFIFDQGPCDDREWLTVDDKNVPKCEKIQCKKNYQENPRPSTSKTDNYEPTSIFPFFYNGTCYNTHDRGFCPEESVLVFTGSNYIPECKIEYEICIRLRTITRSAPTTCVDGMEPDSTGGCEPMLDF